MAAAEVAEAAVVEVGVVVAAPSTAESRSVRSSQMSEV